KSLTYLGHQCVVTLLGLCWLFECGIGISRQYLGPLITIVAGCVSSYKEMRKLMREAVPFGRDHYRHLVSYLLQGGQDLVNGKRIRGAMDEHVKKGKLELAYHLHAAKEILSSKHAFKEGFG